MTTTTHHISNQDFQPFLRMFNKAYPHETGCIQCNRAKAGLKQLVSRMNE